MAGTLQVDTIQSGAVNTPPAIVDSAGTEVGRLCRAFVNFNGTGTVAIRASFNVTSITDNGVGDFTVNLTNAMPDANYCWQITQNGDRCTVGQTAPTVTVNSLRFTLQRTVDLAAQDPTYCEVALFR